MKVPFASDEWCTRMAELEDGCDVSAGSLDMLEIVFNDIEKPPLSITEEG